MSLTSAVKAPAPPGTFDLEEALAWATARLEAWDRVEGIRFLTVPAPVAPVERLLALSRASHGVLWDPPEGTAIAGVGVAELLELGGERRFRQLRMAAPGADQGLVESHPEAIATGPKWIGGLAFDVGSAAEEPWQEFGDGCFSLPRFTYTRQGESGALSLALGRRERPGPVGRQSLLEGLRSLLEGLAQRPDLEEAKTNLPARVQKPSRERWNAQIEDIRRAIGDGLFSKIVAARRSVVELEAPGDATAILGRLARGLRASTRFAFRRNHSLFLGATPERLIARQGNDIRTEALAGSIASGTARQAMELLNSSKDLEEHRLVVEEIVRRLEPLCGSLSIAATPQIRELREVLHLRTPIRGQLRHPVHVVDLVRELHPTPAVGGVPTGDALRWIAQHEPAARGWYAGPIGWFDGAGDGDFAVALRTCLLRDRQAYLYAGAGIVADSDPHLEYQETELKKQTLLAALGA